MGKNRSFDRYDDGRPPTEDRLPAKDLIPNDKGWEQTKNSFSELVECLNAECLVGWKGFPKREQIIHPSQEIWRPFRKQENHDTEKPTSFEEQLDLTDFWLEEAFPKLFTADDYLPMDLFILRDLKRDYKKKRFKQGYPKGLVIEAALSRYKKSYGYLECLQEGAYRYNLKGEQSGIVTREEHEAAGKILATL